MRTNPIYILLETIVAARSTEPPPEINGDMSARLAWKLGYWAALETVMTAFGIEKKPAAAPAPESGKAAA